MKKNPIGISDFKVLISEGYAYVDKTLFIQELVEKGVGRVTLIPRMRRFGKTLNLSMLRYFFEKVEEDTSHLFAGLEIWQYEKYRTLQGQYPVIFLTLKDIKHDSCEKTFAAIRRLIAKEYDRHAYLLESSVLSVKEKEDFHAVLKTQENEPLFEDSLLMLSTWLQRHYNKRVLLLIDEYDTPAHAAYLGGYYDTFIEFLRNWLSAGLKDNRALEFGVLTGILRIAKESIFSGLNNISTYSILNGGFQDKFGFLEAEVKTLLREYDLEEKLSDMRTWYDGYLVGSTRGIYNPWSVLKCIESRGAMAPYWVNTSDNALISRLITQGSGDIKTDLEELIRSGSIAKNIEEGTIFTDFDKNPEAVWSLLLFTGYLTISEPVVYGIPTPLKIPNREVGELYQTLIHNWFKQTVHTQSYELLLKSLITGDIDTFSKIFQEFLITAFSVFDVTPEQPERVYHAFVLGMLIGLKDKYEVRSNRESGFGRYDVTLFPKNPNDLGIVMEFKKLDRYDKSDLETAVEAALKQIEAKQYAKELTERGVTRILFIGLAFEGKRVLIRAQAG